MFFVLMLALLIAGVIFAFKWQSRFDLWNQAFAFAGRRFNGQFTAGGWFNNPAVSLPYAGTHARLTTYTLHGSQGPRCLELIVQFTPARYHCEISPRQAKLRLTSGMGNLQPFALDFDDFGRRWHVAADDGDEARLLLSSGVRWQIDQLYQLPERSDVLVSVMPGWLLIRKHWLSRRGIDVEQFVELGLGLYDQILLTRTIGIEFVESSELQVIDDAQCRICGEAFETEIVSCRRCKTPHHRECWEYNGGCSTYGCRETVFLLPQAVRPLQLDAADVPDRRPAKPR